MPLWAWVLDAVGLLLLLVLLYGLALIVRRRILARHGQGHRLNPCEVPYRANIHAKKQLGVTHLLSVSAVGSLREHLPPGTMLLPDQVIDRTVDRERTFFEGGVVGHRDHIGGAEPVHDTADVVSTQTRQGGERRAR